MSKSDSELVAARSYFTRPKDRTANVGATYEMEFPDVHVSYAQLNGSDTVSTSTETRSYIDHLSGKLKTDPFKPLASSKQAMSEASSREISSGEISTVGGNQQGSVIPAPKNFQWWWSSFEGPGGACPIFMEPPGYSYNVNYQPINKCTGKGSSEPTYLEAPASLQPRGCLFVAGYPTSSSDEDIIELLWIQFSRWGIVDNIKLTFTNTGVPFGFVYFEDFRSADTFLRESDRVYIRRSLLRVEDARVNRSLYVTHMDGSKTHGQTLALQLERHGKVLALDYDENVLITPNRGAWLVRYALWDEAIAAYQWLRSMGCWCIEWGAQVGQSGQTIVYNLIYVDGLDSHIVDRRMVVGMFQQYGEIRSANLICRSATSFAFIEYYNPLSSFRAIRGCHEMSWLGQVIRVQHYRRSPTRNYPQ